MRKAKDYWTSVYNEFCRSYPDLAEDILDWYPSAQFEITVKLTGDRRYAYTMFGKLYDIRDNDKETDINDEEWKKRFSKKMYDRMCVVHTTQEILSKETGISQTMISKYMTGKSIPSCLNAIKMARALKCSVSELMDE